MPIFRSRRLRLLLIFLLSYGMVSATGSRIHVIPEPVSVTDKPGSFTLREGSAVSIEGDSLSGVGAWLVAQVRDQTGIKLHEEKGNRGAIVIDVDKNRTNGREGYTLSVSSSGIRIHAATPAGAFYGMQTFLQLLPPGRGDFMAVPCVDIVDSPRFAWRGLMLDVSRHFFTKQEVKKYIDEMVRYKYNTLHLHLSDDQGWRIEIKSLPELTKHGAWRVKRTGAWGEYLPPLADEQATDGGFYTQDDMREIIRYAQERFVTILPEIDVPAHSLALISSYPNLSCTQLQYPVNPGARPPVREDNALCIGNDSVFLVLDKIFTELAALFPCPYIHIGGDEAYKGFWAECPKCQKRMADEHLKDVDELQSYFVKRMEKMLTAKGKKLIGWDEILEGGLAPSATVMSWRGMAGGIAAAKMGHEVVMTPWDYCYLDLYQGEPTAEPPTYGLCRLKDSYTYDPVPDSVDERLILGGQGNLWSERVPNFRQVEYMTWPRGLALSEVYWSPKAKRNWDDFIGRMEAEFQRMDAANIKYARSAYNVILTPKRAADRTMVVGMSTEINGLDIYYTFDDTNPDKFYPKYDGTPVRFPIGATQLNVITYRNGHPIGQQVNIKKDELMKRLDQGRHVY
ncbi:MAG TPA: family 20 glycosylhydrolase [Puia sp.]|nr:family 20 glycosylhydrolase [Puia sp.]